MRNAIWAYGRATSRFRPLPDFLILGAQKAGTTALYAYLSKHPRITGPSWKEISYFDRHYARGPSWYRGNFPNLLRTRGELVGEASPSYLFHPLAPGAGQGARARGAPRRARPEPGRPRALPLQPRGRAGPRAALVRGRDRRRGEAPRRRGVAPPLRSALLQRRVVEPHLQGARQVRGAARALARRLPTGAAPDPPQRGAPGRAGAARTRRCSSSSAHRRTGSTPTRGSTSASTRE